MQIKSKTFSAESDSPSCHTKTGH